MCGGVSVPTERRWCLGIDTAGPVVGVALWWAGEPEPAFERTERVARGADGLLVPWIAAALAQVDDDGDLGAGRGLVGVSAGPGAFTGLRVGLALAMGLGVARRLEVVPVSSLAARAAMVGAPVLVLLDARKDRVYAGAYTFLDGLPQLEGAEQDVSLAEVLPAAPFRCVGEGAVVYRAQIEAAGGEVVSAADRCPAAALAALGLRLPASCRVSPAAVSPHYIRPADITPPRGGGPAGAFPVG